MKGKRILFSLMVIAGLALAGLFLSGEGQRAGTAEDASLLQQTGREGPAREDRDGTAARDYLAGVPGDAVFPGAADPASRGEVDRWEARIHRYTEDRASHDPDEAEIRALARKTAGLFRLLRQASEREKTGLEPYTGMSGFNTMALTIALENEFQEQTGGTFSDFLYSLDPDLIRQAALGNPLPDAPGTGR